MRVTILSPLTPRFYCDKAVLLVELSELVVRAQHLNDLVLVHLLHLVASRTAVLTWVELSWLLVEHLANGSGECQT